MTEPITDEVARLRTTEAMGGEDDLAKLRERLGTPAPPTPEQLRLCGMTGHTYGNLTVKQQWQVHGRIQEAAAYAWKDVVDNG